jgi:hypothetical protein
MKDEERERVREITENGSEEDQTLNSYTKLSMWLEEVSEEPHAWLARAQVKQIPSPYAYSPTKGVYSWNGKNVVWFETKHRHFEVFEVPADLPTFISDEDATAYNTAHS